MLPDYQLPASLVGSSCACSLFYFLRLHLHLHLHLALALGTAELLFVAPAQLNPALVVGRVHRHGHAATPALIPQPPYPVPLPTHGPVGH